MKQPLLKLSDAGVIMRVAHYSIDPARYVSTTHIANDGSVCCSEALSEFLELIVVLNRRLDTAVGGYVYTHLLQKFSRAF